MPPSEHCQQLLDRQKANLTEQFTNQVKGLQETINQRNLTIVSLNDKNAQLSATVDSLNSEKAQLNETVNALNDENEKLNNENNQLNTENNQLKGENDQLQETVTAQEQTIADLKQEIEELKNPSTPPPPPPEEKTLWGANVGGWAATKGEPPATAFSRIQNGFGKINAVRWWPNKFFQWSEVPPFYTPGVPLVANMGSDINGINAGNYDADMERICSTATRLTWLTVLHEPEDDGFNLSAWQSAQMRLAAIKTRVANPKVKFGPLMMGACYHATRYVGCAQGNPPASTWLNFDMKDCDFVGGDFYQWGKGDADADHAATVISPAITMAKSKGKKLVIGELGARRRNTGGVTGVSDDIRARFINETAALVVANPNVIDVICYYEVDRGAADKVPWNLLETDSAQAVAAYKALCMQ